MNATKEEELNKTRKERVREWRKHFFFRSLLRFIFISSLSLFFFAIPSTVFSFSFFWCILIGKLYSFENKLKGRKEKIVFLFFFFLPISKEKGSTNRKTRTEKGKFVKDEYEMIFSALFNFHFLLCILIFEFM